MDNQITKTPKPSAELKELIEKARNIYDDNFNKDTWFGRCIFLSWYCERGTCTFCFRSVQKHNIKHPEKARRSIASILAEAMMIKAFGWRIEFLTGGYGITNNKELVRIIKLVSQVLDEKIWVNLGEIGSNLLEEFQPYVKGIISSIETLNPELHKEVCPDKPIKPFEDMINISVTMGFKQGMTIVIGLGEQKDDFKLLDNFIKRNCIERITIYALRPVQGTRFTKGPDPLDVAWWVAKTRIANPSIEIIVGSAHYRIPELSLLLNAGANAITKLPATSIFNTKKGLDVEKEVKKANRNFISKFSSKNPLEEANWDEMLSRTELSTEEKKEVMNVLKRYLKKFDERKNF
ncbi:MAG: radical SAM protein [Nanoarchaeota archaeon]|nr:radical SAM protein [Nanoarchaeota archaeon]MBU1854959.1 radical SAM protein [Nanoarchaeota archaeon]